MSQLYHLTVVFSPHFTSYMHPHTVHRISLGKQQELYLEESDCDLNVFWYRPHHHPSVRVFDTRLPAVSLPERKNKRINHFSLRLVCFILFDFFNLQDIIRTQTLEDFRRLLRVHTTTSLSGCLVKKKQSVSEKSFIHQSSCLCVYQHINIMFSSQSN